MATLDICLPIKWASGQIRRGRWTMYWPKTTQVYKAALDLALLPYKTDAFLEGPLSVSLWFFRPRPKSAPKRKWFTVKPDFDNLEKPTLDCMSGVLYGDDAHIVDSDTHKRYGDNWELHIRIEALDGEPEPPAVSMAVYGGE